MTEGTAYFAERLSKLGTYEWKPNLVFEREHLKLLEDAEQDFEIEVASHIRDRRHRELEAHVLKNCYQNKDYTYLQAERCEKFHMDNDYKLRLINKFFKELIWKHALEHEKCSRGAHFDSLPSVEAKDLYYLECNKKWMEAM